MSHRQPIPRGSQRALARSAALLLGAVVALALPPTAGASVVRALDVEQLVGLSDLVVEGRVGLPEQSRNGVTGRPMTDTPIHVIATLHGAAPEGGVVRVRQTRGVVDGQRVKVVGDPQLTPGDRVILMLRFVDGHHYLTALSQAVFWLREDRTPISVEQRLDGLVRLTESDHGLVPLPPGFLAAPTTAPELRARIRAAGGVR